MEARKPLRRRSAPASSHTKAFKKLTSDSLIDPDLVKDILTLELIRHPVAASDGRVHEAQSLLGYLQTGGRSPILMGHIFSSAVYLLPLKNTLDRLYREDENRHTDYEIAPVLEAIKGWLKHYNDKNDPIDLRAQNQIQPDDEDEPVQAAANNVLYQNTFLYSFLTWQRDRSNVFCLPPISFWPQRLNEPGANAAVNAFLSSEAIVLIFALVIHAESQMNFSAIFDTCMTSLIVGGSIAAFTGLAVELNHRLR